MTPAYPDLQYCVQQLAPSWCKTQHDNLALLLRALFERPTLCLSDLARTYPEPAQSLHGRLKRLMKFLDNPRLDELVLYQRWLRLRTQRVPPLRVDPDAGGSEPAAAADSAGHDLFPPVRGPDCRRSLWQPGLTHCPDHLSPHGT